MNRLIWDCYYLKQRAYYMPSTVIDNRTKKKGKNSVDYNGLGKAIDTDDSVAETDTILLSLQN